LDELCVLDGLEEERALCEEEKLRKDKIISDLEMAITLEEISWMQKSRALWLREWDKCTSFSIKWLI
jgi:hypothetical protein